MQSMPRKRMPPLEVGCSYELSNFDYFDYTHAQVRGESGRGEPRSVLRLHLQNGTTIELPLDARQRNHLARLMAEACVDVVIDHLKSRGLIQS
jgi:hypothetical protein